MHAQGGTAVDFAEPRVQQQMDASLELYRQNEFVVAETMSSWWEGLKSSNNGSAPGVRPIPATVTVTVT